MITPPMPVLIDDGVTAEHRDAVRSLGVSWLAPSGRSYLLDLAGATLTVALAPSAVLGTPPSGAEIDDDLLDLAGAIYDAIGGEWSAEALRKVAEIWPA